MTHQDARQGLAFEPSSGESREHTIQRLQAHVAELEEELRLVSLERDEALAQVDELRGRQLAFDPVDARDSIELPKIVEGMCTLCDGEGIFWIHDFRMECTRCNGTGRDPSH